MCLFPGHFPEIPCLFPQGPFERTGPRYCRPLLLVVCETALLNPVQESLKSRNRIYQLVRTGAETRVNDYNPLLLMLWKANIDIQFVAEASLPETTTLAKNKKSSCRKQLSSHALLVFNLNTLSRGSCKETDTNTS